MVLNIPGRRAVETNGRAAVVAEGRRLRIDQGQARRGKHRNPPVGPFHGPDPDQLAQVAQDLVAAVEQFVGDRTVVAVGHDIDVEFVDVLEIAVEVDHGDLNRSLHVALDLLDLPRRTVELAGQTLAELGNLKPGGGAFRRGLQRAPGFGELFGCGRQSRQAGVGAERFTDPAHEFFLGPGARFFGDRLIELSGQRLVGAPGELDTDDGAGGSGDPFGGMAAAGRVVGPGDVVRNQLEVVLNSPQTGGGAVQSSEQSTHGLRAFLALSR